jgi:hypothetical protein
LIIANDQYEDESLNKLEAPRNDAFNKHPDKKKAVLENMLLAIDEMIIAKE